MSELDQNKAKIDDFIRGLPPVIPRLEAHEIPGESDIIFSPSAFGRGYISEDGHHAVKIIDLRQRIDQTPVDNIIESLKSELINYYAIAQRCPESFCKLVGYHYDILNTTLTIVMENCGMDLFDIYNSKSKPDIKTQIKHIGQIIDVIECLHDKLFVHFDIKLENIVLHDGKIKLIDAGSLTYVNVSNIVYVRGTDFYMAPELHKRKKIENSVGLLSTDIYSLGVLFLLMILPSGRFRNKIIKNMEATNFSDINFDGDDKRIIKNWLERVFGKAIEFEDFFGEPDKRKTIKELKSMYELKQARDQMTSGGRSIRKTHKRRSNKRRLDKRQRKSKSKSNNNK